MADAPPTATSLLTDDFSLRFTVVSDKDHSGILWVVTILCAIYALLTLSLRYSAKRRNLGIDDWIAVAATITSLIEYITTFIATHYGLGKSYEALHTSQAESIGKALLAGEVFLFIGLCLAKCSLIFLCRRLFSINKAKEKHLCDCLTGLSMLWAFGSILGVTIRCTPLENIGFQRTFCTNLVLRWTLVGAFDTIIEGLIFALALYVVWPLQMSIVKKSQVLVGFALRLPLIAFIWLQVASLHDSTGSKNTGVALALPIVFRQAGLVYALFSAAVPSLNSWLRKFDTSMATGFGYNSNLYASNERSGIGKGPAYMMGSMDKSLTRLRSRSSRGPKVNEVLGPIDKKHQYVASCEHQLPNDMTSIHSHEENSMKSQNSDDMIIRKDVRYNVRYESPVGGYVESSD